MVRNILLHKWKNIICYTKFYERICEELSLLHVKTQIPYGSLISVVYVDFSSNIKGELLFSMILHFHLKDQHKKIILMFKRQIL